MPSRGSTLADRLGRLWYARTRLTVLLWPAAALMGLAASLRRWLYVKGVLRSYRIDACVVVVGNITVGGTGKTPITAWIARALRERGYTVGIVCSGYGGQARRRPQRVTPGSDPAAVGDEAVLLAQQTGCPVAAGRDRVAAARKLLDLGPLHVIVSDDGLQHYRMQRDVELAVVDGSRGLGNGFCLPLGPLREPPRRLRSVDAVIVNDGAWGDNRALRCAIIPSRARHLASEREVNLTDFRGRCVHAVAGIGNPERFFAALERNGIRLLRHPLADHAAIDATAVSFGDDLPILLTEKDAVKCTGFAAGNIWSVVADVRFENGDDEQLMQLLMRSAGCPGRA